MWPSKWISFVHCNFYSMDAKLVKTFSQFHELTIYNKCCIGDPKEHCSSIFTTIKWHCLWRLSVSFLLNMLIKLCSYVTRSRDLSSQRPLGSPHTTLERSCVFYPLMSKLQYSINIYPWFWRRLTCSTQTSRNMYGNVLNVTSSWYSIVTSRWWCLIQWFDPNHS